VSHVERKHGPVWYVKYRLPSGKQVQKKLGPARTERGRPPAGYFTKRTAEAQLRTMLEDARRGILNGSVETGVTFAEAAAEWLRFIAEDRERKQSSRRAVSQCSPGRSCPHDRGPDRGHDRPHDRPGCGRRCGAFAPQC
jgi:hypothetical protein